jgi:hypothetical protein
VQAGSLKDGKPSLPEPYGIDVVAPDQNNALIGGVQRFEGETPIELIEKLSMAYGHLYQHLKIIIAERKQRNVLARDTHRS